MRAGHWSRSRPSSGSSRLPCSELFGDSHRSLLHTTSAVRYPVFTRSRDGSLKNYSGTSPQFGAHPWLRRMVETTLASELAALPAAIVVPLGGCIRLARASSLL